MYRSDGRMCTGRLSVSTEESATPHFCITYAEYYIYT